MDEIIKFLNQNWIGTLIGIGGTFIGILGYLARPRSRLAAQTNTLQLVGPNAVLPSQVEFLFRGDKVPNVTMSKIAIWNSGNTTVKGDQIVSSDPLRIVTSTGSNILEENIENRTRQVNDFSCIVRQNVTNEVECRFDYLDAGDGALIQLIHTGTDTVKVVGTLRGVPKGIRVVDVPRKQRPQAETQLSPFGMRLLSLAFIVLGISAFIFLGRSVGAALVAGGLVLFFTIRYLPPSPLSTQMTSNAPQKAFWQSGRR